jgi:hypothetical protein
MVAILCYKFVYWMNIQIFHNCLMMVETQQIISERSVHS